MKIKIILITSEEYSRKKKKSLAERKNSEYLVSWLRVVRAVRQVLRSLYILGKTSGPSVSAASAAAASVTSEVRTAAVSAATTVWVIVMGTAVMRMRYDLVCDRLLLGSKELLQTDYAGDQQSDLADEQGFTSDQSDRS